MTLGVIANVQPSGCGADEACQHEKSLLSPPIRIVDLPRFRSSCSKTVFGEPPTPKYFSAASFTSMLNPSKSFGMLRPGDPRLTLTCAIGIDAAGAML